MSLLSGLGRGVSRGPKATIAIILVLTLVFTYFGMDFVNEADPNAFNPDHELIKASDEVSETFGTQQYSVMLVIKAKDGDLLDIADMKELIEFEAVLWGDPDIAREITSSPTNPTGVTSIADMLVMSYGLLQARVGMDMMLAGMASSLDDLVTLLESPAPNETKAEALMTALAAIGESLGSMQSGNGGIGGGFNRTASLATLDAIAAGYGTDPIPAYIKSLSEYDVAGAGAATGVMVEDINSSVTAILPHVGLLYGMPMGPEEATMTLMGVQYALPGLQAGAGSLDKTIPGLYYGIAATLSKDFDKSGGTKAKGAMMNINFNVELESDERLDIETGIQKAAEDMDGHLEYGILGMELIYKEIQESMDFSQMFLLVMVVILIIVILTITFRGLFDTALTMICLGMAILWSYGIAILIGLQGSIIAQVVPILLVGLGVDYGIHMTMRFREEKAKGGNNRKATRIAISTVGMALLLATITTSIGFLSNSISSLSILRDFAILVTIGIIASFVIMTTFQPAVKMVMTLRKERKAREKEGKGSKKDKKDKKDRTVKKKHVGKATSLVVAGAKAGDRHPGAVFVVLFIVSGAAAYGAMQVDTVFDFLDFLPEQTEAKKTIDFIYNEFKFGDTETGDIYIKGDVTDPAVLDAMDRTIKASADDKRVVPGIQAHSILAVMQRYAHPSSPTETNADFIVNWTLADTDGDGVPEGNVKALYDILFDWNTSKNEVIGVLHRSDAGTYDAALVQIRVSSDNLRKADILREELNDDAEPLKDLTGDGPLDRVYVIGSPIVTDVVIDELNAGQFDSIIITLIASTIVLTVVFLILERSIVLGLITSIPIMLVILWILGTMYVIGYDLNVMTITIASLTVGMGVTYAIHVTERFTEDLRHFKKVGQACENTLTHTGMALAGAFMTTAGGFGILMFHTLPPLQQFGVMIALSITYSFLASTYILPTFLILWAKWRQRHGTVWVEDKGKKKKRKGKKGKKKA